MKDGIIHDYLYDNALRTKKEADLIFLDGMTVPGVPKWKRTIMYWRCGCLAGETTTAANRRRKTESATIKTRKSRRLLNHTRRWLYPSGRSVNH